MYLTRTGTVVYLGRLHNFMFVDEEGLRTGRITLVDFKINDAVADSVLRRPLNMHEVYINVYHNGQGISDVREGLGGENFHDQPMDMDLPILDILDHAKSSNQPNQEWMDLCDREDWREDIERYAPGYLALEAAGNGADYNHRCLAMPSKIEGTKKPVLDRLHSDPRVILFPRRG